MTTLDETKEELAKTTSLVITARKLLAGGALLDLSAIEERVRSFCTMVTVLPKEEGLRLRDDALALIDRLGRLEADLKDRIDHLGREPEA